MLYQSYIRPSLEYCSTVWTNISKEQMKKIENLQLAAARIGTGAIKGTRHSAIYEECKWVTTMERRERKNQICFYKIVHNMSPTYLKEILPPQRHVNLEYNLRNRNNLQQIPSRTTSHQNSFFPSQIRSWNLLPPEIRNIDSLPNFKHHLTANDGRCEKHKYTGDRYGQIIHARMRMGCSPLRHQLKEMKIIEEEACDCGYEREDPEHFFLHCAQYNNIRPLLLNNDIQPALTLNTQTLLHGDSNAPARLNTLLFNRVIEYIISSDIF